MNSVVCFWVNLGICPTLDILQCIVITVFTDIRTTVYVLVYVKKQADVRIQHHNTAIVSTPGPVVIRNSG